MVFLEQVTSLAFMSTPRRHVMAQVQSTCNSVADGSWESLFWELMGDPFGQDDILWERGLSALVVVPAKTQQDFHWLWKQFLELAAPFVALLHHRCIRFNIHDVAFIMQCLKTWACLFLYTTNTPWLALRLTVQVLLASAYYWQHGRLPSATFVSPVLPSALLILSGRNFRLSRPRRGRGKVQTSLSYECAWRGM